MPTLKAINRLSLIFRSSGYTTRNYSSRIDMFSSVVGSSWKGFAALKHLMIFGDSYSAVGFEMTDQHPSQDHPLGVKFPGMTFTEDGESPNWVGHLLTKSKAESSLLVYNYAVGGHTISGVETQVAKGFLPHAGKKPSWAPWSVNDTLFITWIGINDCAFSAEHDENLEDLFEVQESLYKEGARNFMFIDVPPIHRSPAVLSYTSDLDSGAKLTYENWNENLSKYAEKFYAKHSDATILMYSSWTTFITVLDNPVSYGFTKDDVSRAGGRIWMDYLHPTSRVHEVIADDILKFLRSIPAYKSDEAKEEAV